MSQRNTDEDHLPDDSGEAGLEQAQQGGVAADVQDVADPVTEAEPLSEMDFFRKLFFRK